ncbi:MAG TPA: transporter [Gemmatimonadaceae bacterium]
MTVLSRSCALLLAIAPPLSAQSPVRDPHEVQPERPTIATHAGTVAKGWLELEEGGEWDKAADGSRSFFAPTNLKLGLSSNLQLNVQVALIADPRIRNGNLTPGDLTLGVKYRILDDAPILGDFAVLPSLKLPTATEGNGGTGTTDFSLLLISSHELGQVEMDINTGATRRTGDGRSAPTTAYLWTTSFGIPIRGPLGAALEIFGYPGTSGPAGGKGIAALLAGPTYLVRKWLAIDAGIISPITGPQAHAVYTGFVWNCGTVCGHHRGT